MPRSAHPVGPLSRRPAVGTADAASPRLDRGVAHRRALAHDASHYLLIPEAIAVPRGEEEVRALLASARASRTPLTFRSGGTSLSGQAQTDAVLADVRRGFRTIEVLEEGVRVRVGPGATVRAVNARLSRHGRRLGPDPASEVACTIGGVIANNSSGMAAGITENSYRTLESLRFVLPSGTVVDTALPDADARLRHEEPGLHAGLLRLRDRVRDDAEARRIIAERFALKNTMGYGINALLDFEEPAQILAHLVVGSEGTLAFVSSAVFRTVPIAAEVATGLLVLPSLREATEALDDVVAAGFATVELLDARSLVVAQQLPGAPREISGITVDAHAALLVEQRAETPQLLAEKLAAAQHLAAGLRLTSPFEMTQDRARTAALWTARKGLYAAVAGARPAGSTALLEDVVVPVGHLAATCAGLETLFARHGYDESVIFGHAKDGNIHFLLNEHLDQGSQRLEAFTEQMVDLVLEQGGNLKAEHGTGRAMAPFVERQYGPALYEVMREIKRLVDPLGILNPGVVLTEDPQVHMRDLKPVVPIEEEADRCVECGYCEPVCPSRDLTLTPRQRIVLRREERLAAQRGDAATASAIRTSYDYEGLQTCAVDGMCVTACPVGINTGDLVRRLRAEQAGPVESAAWTAAAGSWVAVTRGASAAVGVAGAVAGAGPMTPGRPARGRQHGPTAAPHGSIGSRQRVGAVLPRAATALGRAVLGEDVVPDYRPELPRHGGAVRRPGGRGRASAETVAVLMPSCTGTMFGPAEGPRGDQGGCGGACGCSGQPGTGAGSLGASRALDRLLERARVRAVVPDGIEGLCCGTPFSSKGMTEAKERMRSRLREVLVAAAQREATGAAPLPVVVDAASCTEGVHAALEGTGIEVIDATTFVRRELLGRLAVTERAGSVTVHPTCSTTHLGASDDLVALAGACADQVVVPVAWGCCAYAGDRGMLHPELTASATRAEAAEVAQQQTEWYVSANRTCELGMSAATGQTYRHVLELVEAATR